jgi:hypothetical protein
MQEMSVCRAWSRRSSQLLGIDVAGAQEGSWGCLSVTSLYLNAKPSHVGADVDELACHLHHPAVCG